METVKPTDPAVLLRIRDEVGQSILTKIVHVAELRKRLADEELALDKLKASLDCDHEFDPNQPNGMQLIESTCIKCGYTWYD